MNNFKFRAWDIKMKTMLNWEEIQGQWESEGYCIDLFYPYQDHYKCMQYIGLTDKNNKEIYEGDIVKYLQPYSKRWDTNTVLWDKMFAGFGMFETNNEWCKESDWLKIKEIEIVGNIYENSVEEFNKKV